jgi:hypothetical protein
MPGGLRRSLVLQVVNRAACTESPSCNGIGFRTDRPACNASSDWRKNHFRNEANRYAGYSCCGGLRQIGGLLPDTEAISLRRNLSGGANVRLERESDQCGQPDSSLNTPELDSQNVKDTQNPFWGALYRRPPAATRKWRGFDSRRNERNER